MVNGSSTLCAIVRCSLLVEACPSAMIEIYAQSGKFVEGSVSPGIAGLNIEVTAGDVVVAAGTTDQNGKYR